MRHILNPKNAQQLDKNLNLAMPTFGPTNREYYNLPLRDWSTILIPVGGSSDGVP